jgi:hypothetical protein
LRQKIKKYKNGETHSLCQKIKCKAETKVLESAVYESLKKDETKMAQVFRMVYNIVKKGRPYTDMAHDIELQKLNGLDLGHVLH